MQRLLPPLLALCLTISCFSSHAATNSGRVGMAAASAKPYQTKPPRARVGLVLSGGGTKGSAHVGVLRALEEFGIRVDYIAGTSVGAVIGAMYASGMSVDDIQANIGAIDWNDLLKDETSRRAEPIQNKRGDYNYQVKAKPGFRGGQLQLPLGVSQGQKVTQLLRKLYHPVNDVKDFDKLPIPLRVIATSLETSEMVVFSRGDLAMCVKASMSLPAFFAPVEINGEYLVDGGVTANLPVSVVRAMGADIVIAVDITSGLLAHDEIHSVLGVTEQLINFMTQKNVAEQVANLRAGDLLIKPRVRDIGVFDFANSMAAIDRGYRAALDQQLELQRIAAASSAYQNAISKAGRVSRVTANKPSAIKPYVVHFIEAESSAGLGREALLARLNIPLGEPLDTAALNRGISRLYGSGLYQRVDYSLISRDGQTGMRIRADPKSWGPDYLQFGLQLQEDFSADANFNIGIAYLRTGINGLGGQLRTQLDLGIRQGLGVEWQQPLSHDGRWFTRLESGIKRSNIRVYSGDLNQDRAIADLRVRELGGQFSLGTAIGRAAEIELSVKRLFGDAEVVVGELAFSGNEFDLGEFALNYRLDTLNSTNRPTSGSVVRFGLIQSSEPIGGEGSYQQVIGSAAGAFALGNYRGYINLLGGSTVAKSAPLQSQFKLGGLGRLSGYPVDRFYGQHVGLVSTNFSRTYRAHSALPLFTGASVETGNVWSDRFGDSPDNWIVAGSVYAGFDTFIGPVYLAAGFAESGNSTVYLYLGNPFVARPARPFD